MTPASVGSLDAASQQPPLDASATKMEPKAEVKHEDEEEESDSGSCSKGGKLSNHKAEEKPVKLEPKKECSGDKGKGVPMDTSKPSAAMKTEVKKPEESSEAAAPQAPVKKKSKALFYRAENTTSQTS